MLLRLETVLVSSVCDGVNEAVGAGVLVAALYFDGLMVFADLLESAGLLACGAVACFEPGRDSLCDVLRA